VKCCNCGRACSGQHRIDGKPACFACRFDASIVRTETTLEEFGAAVQQTLRLVNPRLYQTPKE
jgi:hypothetical protein